VTGFLWFLLGLVGLTLGLHLVARLLFVQAAAKIFGQAPWLPSGWREPPDEGEGVLLTTADGRRLRGTYLAARSGPRRGAIACCHEFNGDRWNMLRYAEGLRRRGFDTLLFDFGNHGASDPVPGYDPAPWVTTYETADVRAAVDYLATRDVKIGLFGVGRGATAALCAAGDPRVRAVALEGAFPTERLQVHTLREMLAGSIPWCGWLYRLPEAFLAPLAQWVRLVVGWRRHCRFVRVGQSARRVHAPVLMIHGQCDPCVPIDLVCGLRDAIAGPTQLWVVPCAKHDDAVRVAPEEYAQRVAQFFADHLAPEPVPEPVPSLANSPSPAPREPVRRYAVGGTR